MLNNVQEGANAPNLVNVVIEIPAQSEPVKYEIDKNTGALFVDRFLGASMRYPCDYGYVPNTLSEDGDPVDVLVISPVPLLSGAVIEVRPIGMLNMTDEKGKDVKILAVPSDKLTTLYKDWHNPKDAFPLLIRQIEHFFKHYKDLEDGRWVKIDGWNDAAEAKQEIINSIERFKQTSKN